MTLRDFARKHLDNARQNGILDAAHGATTEMASKTVLRWAIDRRAEAIWSLDWDVCLVLDSCRWDTWYRVDGRGRPAWSIAGTSLEWTLFGRLAELAKYIDGDAIDESVDRCPSKVQ